MDNYKEIDRSKWAQVGEGGNGRTYMCQETPNVILKVNNARLSTLECVMHEYEAPKAVEVLELQTPQVLEIVRVGDVVGTISLKSIPVRRIIRNSTVWLAGMPVST